MANKEGQIVRKKKIAKNQAQKDQRDQDDHKKDAFYKMARSLFPTATTLGVGKAFGRMLGNSWDCPLAGSLYFVYCPPLPQEVREELVKRFGEYVPLDQIERVVARVLSPVPSHVLPRPETVAWNEHQLDAIYPRSGDLAARVFDTVFWSLMLLCHKNLEFPRK
jgi:hypothetical protein